MQKLLFICEDFVPPVTDGSRLVYFSCLKSLARKYEIFAVMFGDSSSVPSQTDQTLRSLCKAHIIVRGGPILNLLGTLARAVTGARIAPRFLEELGRSDSYKQIEKFIQLHTPEILYLHKYHCVPRFGSHALSSFKGVKLVDLHDDFVGREVTERKVLKDLFQNYPLLRGHFPYARMRNKHLLFRFSEARSRRQELKILSQFDLLLSASKSEADDYSKFLPGRVIYCPWPIVVPSASPDKHRARYSAGFIGADSIFNLDGLLMFVSGVLPEIRSKNPTFSFAVAGGISDPFKLALPEFADLGVTVMGHLTDVGEFYNSVSTVVVPLLHGTGVSIKTLEAVSYQIPILATPTGVRGIPSDELSSNVIVRNIGEFSEALQHLDLPQAVSQPNIDYVSQFLATFNEAVANNDDRDAPIEGLGGVSQEGPTGVRRRLTPSASDRTASSY